MRWGQHERPLISPRRREACVLFPCHGIGCVDPLCRISASWFMRCRRGKANHVGLGELSDERMVKIAIRPYRDGKILDRPNTEGARSLHVGEIAKRCRERQDRDVFLRRFIFVYEHGRRMPIEHHDSPSAQLITGHVRGSALEADPLLEPGEHRGSVTSDFEERIVVGEPHMGGGQLGRKVECRGGLQVEDLEGEYRANCQQCQNGGHRKEGASST